MKEIKGLRPREIRERIRNGEWGKPTAGLAMGYAQANLVILPLKHAFDFLLFCQRNPKPCPLLEVLEPGSSGRTFWLPMRISGRISHATTFTARGN